MGCVSSPPQHIKLPTMFAQKDIVSQVVYYKGSKSFIREAVTSYHLIRLHVSLGHIKPGRSLPRAFLRCVFLEGAGKWELHQQVKDQALAA